MQIGRACQGLGERGRLNETERDVGADQPP